MQVITVQYFSEDWEKIKEIKLPIQSTGGWPVTDAYHTMGDYQSMQLNKEGNVLFVFLYDGYEGTDEEPEPAHSFTALYKFDLTYKRGEKVFEIPRSNHVMWKYLEQRNSILYYDDSLSTFTEADLLTGQKKPLCPVAFNGTSMQLTPTDTDFVFVYTRNDSILKTTYSFRTGVTQTIFLFGYPDFSSYHKQNLLVLGPSWKGNISFVVTPYKKYTANIPFSNFNSYWKNEDQFYIIQKSGIAIYNTRFQLIKSYYLEHPHIYANLSAGLLISYGNQSFAFIDHELTTLTNLPQVHDNFISCIAESH
ncbi:MAG: hypothetical protein K1X81_00965 [Bacteroidia bacterium]|nr:hypothetical protein [Bacteroidia bacterium]